MYKVLLTRVLTPPICFTNRQGPREAGFTFPVILTPPICFTNRQGPRVAGLTITVIAGLTRNPTHNSRNELLI